MILPTSGCLSHMPTFSSISCRRFPVHLSSSSVYDLSLSFFIVDPIETRSGALSDNQLAEMMHSRSQSLFLAQHWFSPSWHVIPPPPYGMDEVLCPVSSNLGCRRFVDASLLDT